MSRRGLYCRNCHAWSGDGVNWLTLSGLDGIYGRPVFLCSLACVAQYAIERTAPTAGAARHDAPAVSRAEQR